MGRFFSIFAAIATLMVVLAGIGIHWLTDVSIENARQSAATSVAQSAADLLSSQLDLLQQTVDGLGRSSVIVDAFAAADVNQLNRLASELQTTVPYALKLRFLLPSVNEIDQSASPHMGFGDLEMVRATLTAKQMAVIQGEGEHRHLAFTSAVRSNDKVIGVILASLQADFVRNLFIKSPFKQGYLELKQDQAILANSGDGELKTEDPETLAIANSRWQILHWPLPAVDNVDLALDAGVIGITVLVACLSFYIGYRRLALAMHQDQSSLLKAAKDMMMGRQVGAYPVNLPEMQPIINAMVQFKRVIERSESVSSATEFNVEKADRDFFDESFDIDYVEQRLAATSAKAEQNVTTAPIRLPTKSFDFGEASFGEAVFPQQQNDDFATMFRAYDIRGIVDTSLTQDAVLKIGKAIGSEASIFGIKTIVIARDGRLSSPGLSQALAKGIVSTGCDVLDVGLVPTPVLYFVAHHTEGRSGVMITGSHNPGNYNGLKMVINGETLAGDKIQKLRQRIETDDFVTGQAGNISQNTLFANEYIGIISEDIHMVRPMKVALDCGNGAASVLGPMLLKTLGCEVVELFCEVDGHFPNHHPDPSKPENLKDLITAVKHYEADIGIAFDGDGDRLGIVDSKGKIIWPDRQMMLFAKDVLSRKPGAEIIYDVKCSKHLGEQIKKSGGRPLMWKTGHSLMKAKLKETAAALAGEMSGHIFFNDRWFGFDDALYSAARMIEILSADTRMSSDVFADFPDSINTPELNVGLEEGENLRFIEQMFSLANFSDGNIVNIDGMRVEFADGWGLVRASNTTPSLVIRFEADNKEALARIQDQFRSLMLQIKPDLSLPF